MATKLAGCVLLDEKGKIGLLHRNKNGITQWELPGGKINPGEEEVQAAQRELKEELGVAVTIKKRLGNASFTDFRKLDFEYTWFIAIITTGAPSICEPEAFDDFRYFTFAQLESIKLSDNMRAFVSQLKSRELKLDQFIVK